MAAAAHNDYEIVKTLLDRGADVNHHDHRGYTALRIATVQKYAAVRDPLKQRGAE